MTIIPTSIPSTAVSRPGGGAVDPSSGTKTPQTSSVEIGDVLEFSGLARLAGSLGGEGMEALRGFLNSGSVTEERLTGFVGQLFDAGNPSGRVTEILAGLGGMGSELGAAGMGDLFSEIESRGISGDLRYLDELDGLFNMGRRDISSLFSAGEEMSDEEFGVFLKSLTTLLDRGVVGTVTVDFRGNPTTVFLENEIGSKYARSPLYPERFPY